MYGIVYKAIRDYVITTFGAELWEVIKAKSGVTLDFSLTEQPYNDDITYKLAEAVSGETGMPIDEVLTAFGEQVIEHTRTLNGFMDSRGDNLKDYLVNLPNFHNRIMLIYPELTPPEFRISQIAVESLYLHYISKRGGLRDFIKGYLKGLAKVFNEKVTVEPIQPLNENTPQEVFKISW